MQVVPLLYSPKFNMTYSISSDGVADGGSRLFLRAKAVLAASYMQGVMGYAGDAFLTIIGEEHILSQLKIDSEHLPDGVYETPLTTSPGLEHIGYIMLPDNENVGWRGHVGWGAFFTRGTPEATVTYLYQVLQPTMYYLLHKKPDIYKNLCDGRFSKTR